MKTQRSLDRFDIKWVAELGLMEARPPWTRAQKRSGRPAAAPDRNEQPRPRAFEGESKPPAR